MQKKELDPKQKKAVKGCSVGCFSVIALFVVICFFAGGGDNDAKKSEPAKVLSAWEQYQWRADRCIVGWYNGFSAKPTYKIANAIKNQLNDPNSYELIDTRCKFPKDSTVAMPDTVSCIVSFMAKNGFGGRVRGSALTRFVLPEYDNYEKECQVLSTDLAE